MLLASFWKTKKLLVCPRNRNMACGLLARVSGSHSLKRLARLHQSHRCPHQNADEWAIPTLRLLASLLTASAEEGRGAQMLRNPTRNIHEVRASLSKERQTTSPLAPYRGRRYSPLTWKMKQKTSGAPAHRSPDTMTYNRILATNQGKNPQGLSGRGLPSPHAIGKWPWVISGTRDRTVGFRSKPTRVLTTTECVCDPKPVSKPQG